MEGKINKFPQNLGAQKREQKREIDKTYYWDSLSEN